MFQFDKDKSSIRYLSPSRLHEQLCHFTKNMAVTTGAFELLIEDCLLEDIEWNHMDQMHRPTIHNTYEKGIRIANTRDFALSLTEWKNWPFFIPVVDIYVAKGLFYQSIALAGIIFVHSIISMEQVGTSVKLKDEWYIASRKWFKFLHKPLNKKLYRLNERLQEEDKQIRQGRYQLREKGYRFRSDLPDYMNSNVLGTNTFYPQITESNTLSLDDVTESPTTKNIGGVEFIVKKAAELYFIWPAACPHEGGPLMQGKHCEGKITCPWHGLQFSAVQLSNENPHGAKYGFEYTLAEGKILVKQNVIKDITSLLADKNVSQALL